MQDTHPSLETLAKWLSGQLDHDTVLGNLAPHFLESCPGCRTRHEELQKLQEEVGHWNPEVAVLESPEASQRLFAAIEDLSWEEQIEQVASDERFHTWGLSQLLLKKSFGSIFESPARALQLADLALRITHHLGDAYHSGWVLDLRARGFAHLANAKRVLGDLKGAEASFQEAEACLAQSGIGNPRIEAEILDLKSSLRRDQRKFDEAEALADCALALYRELRDEHGTAKTLLQRGKILEEKGQFDRAIEWLQQSGAEIDPAREPRLFTSLRYNLLCCLTRAERHAEAAALLPEIRGLFRDKAAPLARVRLRWAEGSIALGLGWQEEAEAAFREVQREFLDRGMDFNAALVALDLAGLLARQSRTGELKRLAVELMAAFEAREIYREALAVLVLFQQACDEERLTAEMARQLATILEERRKGRP